ncbi:dihydrodipicolinate synthase family protein [Paenibacillus sp. H1-7]|uniref:dihydrodipicolinate synthase family protein n=1 Tax=Paenibacillus sp. H1-7 TaxID=2282849 RepID=UPI001EF7CDEC|nr:dihydrodipicolinate synthase family protein [Paenibacillus sp. H1-7]ULL16893.1 dihydrodipicolinate synthase family protein [Paenibacillus sp. H1-7]
MNESNLELSSAFGAVFALLLTPFTQTGAIDWNVYDRYVDWQLSKRPHGLFASCGSSEMAFLTADERLELTRRAVRRAAGTPVIATANVGTNIEEHEQELLRMSETGATGLVLVAPPGLGTVPSQLGEYLARMAEVSPIPVLLYEFPLFKPHFIDPAIYGQLVRQHRVAGIKDTTCTLEGIEAKIAQGGIVYQANTAFMLDSIRQGAGGIMAITSTAASDIVLDLWNNAVLQGDTAGKAAVKAHQQLMFLDGVLCMGFTATAKHLVCRHGITMSSKTRSGAVLSAQAAKAIDIWYESVYLT